LIERKNDDCFYIIASLAPFTNSHVMYMEIRERHKHRITPATNP